MLVGEDWILSCEDTEEEVVNEEEEEEEEETGWRGRW